MSLDTPSPAFSGGVVDDKPVLNVQAGLGERTKLPVNKNVPSRCASNVLDIPSNHDIAVCLVPSQTIVQKAQGGWNRAVLPRIVAVMHIYEDSAARRRETRELTENLLAGVGGKDMSEDIPETRDDVKLAFDQMKFFGAHGPAFSVGTVVALHRHTGFHQNEFPDIPGLCDATGSPSVAGSDIKHGAASRRDLGDHQPIDGVQIRFALFGDAREHRTDAIVRGYRV